MVSFWAVNKMLDCTKNFFYTNEKAVMIQGGISFTHGFEWLRKRMNTKGISDEEKGRRKTENTDI